MELPKAYEPKKYEDAIYRAWEKSGLFAPQIKKGRKPFTIMMPPPNATGTLHLGHAVMLALEDIMVRYHRMKGDPTLWIPGTDHASIATQNKVEKLIAEEGLTRHKLGREAFLKRVEKFVEGSRTTIRNQVRKMGSSCDWSRERYTLEPMLSDAVQEVFVRMHNDGLIYRGNRIVNWCTRCASTLADDEVSHKEQNAKLYYFKYDENFPISIATTRPETKLGDTAVAVHPEDERYTQYIGKSFTIQFAGGAPREIKIIAEKGIDPKFGTGALGVTPAHSQVDFAMGQKNNLPVIDVIDERGKIHITHSIYSGMPADEARKKIVQWLRDEKLMEDEKDIQNNLSVCYRCGTPIEPLISKQWFINVDKKFGKKKKSLKQISIEVVKKGDVKILPDKFNKTYFHWMENLHDWCISRQIWFGHRIPVWYHDTCSSPHENPIVSAGEPTKCPHCNSLFDKKHFRQDPDTLDTWFSSGLWSFSTLGWPKKTADLKYFHPTSVLETGYDILFFWVARMILMTEYALGEIPFKYVYLHGLVRTREGKKMSKSDPKTCIDPLDMIAKYGADALRLSMVIGGSPGNDLRLYEEKIAGYRNFVNKIWNATRFALMQNGPALEKTKKSLKNKPIAAEITAKSLSDKWILTRTQELIKAATADLEAFRFSDAGMKIYDFTWNEYCAWYLEFSKGPKQNLPVIMYVLETLLTLLHPFVPFVTEALWKELQKKKLLMSVAWPKAQKKFIFKNAASEMDSVVETISMIRNLRQENNIAASAKIHVVLITLTDKKVLEEKKEEIMRLARVEELQILKSYTKTGPSLVSVTGKGIEVVIPADGLVDVANQKKRLANEKIESEWYIATIEKKLANSSFTANAPADIVSRERENLARAQERLEKLKMQLSQLSE